MKIFEAVLKESSGNFQAIFEHLLEQFQKPFLEQFSGQFFGDVFGAFLKQFMEQFLEQFWSSCGAVFDYCLGVVFGEMTRKLPNCFLLQGPFSLYDDLSSKPDIDVTVQK